MKIWRARQKIRFRNLNYDFLVKLKYPDEGIVSKVSKDLKKETFLTDIKGQYLHLTIGEKKLIAQEIFRATISIL